MLRVLCLDNRLPDDTLFMVFEEDYRFFPEGQDPDGCDDYGKRVAKILDPGFATAQESESLPPQSQGAASKLGKSSGKGGKPKPGSRFHSTSSRGSSDLNDVVNEGFSSNVADLVRWATVAHRHRMGNFVWVGWCPTRKPSQLVKGSHLIMLSKEGFAHMGQAMTHDEIKRGHLDLVFKEWLLTGSTAQKVGACYIYPQMGGYWRHVSGCDPTNHGEATGGRPSAWDFENPASGTRVGSDPKHRGKWLIQWRGPNPADRQWVTCPSDKELVKPEWIWKSIRDPTAIEQQSLPPQDIQQEVKEDEPEEQKTPAPRSKRSKRAQRQFNKREMYRVWVDTVEEAAVVK